MNNVRRKKLDNLIVQFEDLKSHLEVLKDEEIEYLDNIPENLQSSGKYDKAEEAVSNLELAFDSIDEAISYITDAIE